MTFSSLLGQENLTLTAPSLIHYFHWITPEARSKRYDAHFFLAELPEGQTPHIDHRETIDGVWLAPAEALQGNTSGAIPLTPPALCTEQGLASFFSVHALWEFCITERMSDPIVPILATVEGQEMILLPGDKFYTKCGGEARAHCNNLHQPLRLVLNRGRWLLTRPSVIDTQ
jgi:hypothetical protein